MIIRFEQPEADKPRGIILSLECAEEFAAIRKHNKKHVATSANPAMREKYLVASANLAIESMEDMLDNHEVSSMSSEEQGESTGRMARITLADIMGQEVRLSISHDEKYATAVAITQYEESGNMARPCLRKDIENVKTLELHKYDGSHTIEEVEHHNNGEKPYYKTFDLSRDNEKHTIEELERRRKADRKAYYKKLDLSKDAELDQKAKRLSKKLQVQHVHESIWGIDEEI